MNTHITAIEFFLQVYLFTGILITDCSPLRDVSVISVVLSAVLLLLSLVCWCFIRNIIVHKNEALYTLFYCSACVLGIALIVLVIVLSAAVFLDKSTYAAVNGDVPTTYEYICDFYATPIGTLSVSYAFLLFVSCGYCFFYFVSLKCCNNRDVEYTVSDIFFVQVDVRYM